MHGIATEEARAADLALEVPQPPDGRDVVEPAILKSQGHFQFSICRDTE